MAYIVRKDYCYYELNEKLPIILSYEIYMCYSIINCTSLSDGYYKNDKFSTETLKFLQSI